MNQDFDISAQKKKARDFCQEHLFECCSEVRVWQKTGLLPKGRVEELAAIFSSFCATDDSLRHAEDEVSRQSMDYVLANPPSQSSGDDFKAWYEEAMGATNEAGYVGMDAASVIRDMDSVNAELRKTLAAHLIGGNCNA